MTPSTIHLIHASKIQRPQSQFANFNRRISKLDADAERIARAIYRKLDLKATHASLKEAHTTAIMSAAVCGFTIITIIFTPLSFIVSLFALPIDRLQLQQDQSVWTDQAGMYSTNYVGKWIGEHSNNKRSMSGFLMFLAMVELISVALTLALMWLMIEYGLDVRITEKTWNWIKVLLKIESPDEIQRETGAKTPHANMNAANTGKE